MLATLPEIRLARPDEAHAIARMSRDYIEHGLGWSWTPARVRLSMREPMCNVAVICRRDALQGFGIMHYDDASAHLALLAVHPASRHQGLGGRLVEWLVRSARVAGITQIRLEARVDNHCAIAFYEHLGFDRCGLLPGYYEGRCDAVQLQRRLA